MTGPMSRIIGRWASTRTSLSKIPVPQIAHRVCTSFSNIAILHNPIRKDRLGYPPLAGLKSRSRPIWAHLRRPVRIWAVWMPARGYTRRPSISCISIYGGMSNQFARILHHAGCPFPGTGPATAGLTYCSNQINDLVFIILLRLQFQFIEDWVTPHFVAGERRLDRQRL